MNFPTYPRNGTLFPLFATSPCVNMIGSFSNPFPVSHLSFDDSHKETGINQIF